MTTLADIADPLDLTVSATYDVHNPTPPLPFLPNEVLDSRVAFITFWTKNSIRESSDDQLYSLFGPLISGWQGPTHQTQEKPPAHLTRYDWFLQQEIAHTSRFRDANRNEVEATLADIRRWIRDDLEFAFLPTETHYELLLRTHPSWFDIDDGLDFTEQVQENVDNLYSLLAFHHRIPGHENIIYITPVLFILRTMLHDACYQGDRIRGFKALDIAIYETVSHEMVHFIGTKMNGLNWRTPDLLKSSRPVFCKGTPEASHSPVPVPPLPPLVNGTGSGEMGEYTCMMRWGACVNFALALSDPQDVKTWRLLLVGNIPFNVTTTEATDDTIRARHYDLFKNKHLFHAYFKPSQVIPAPTVLFTESWYSKIAIRILQPSSTPPSETSTRAASPSPSSRRDTILRPHLPDDLISPDPQQPSVETEGFTEEKRNRFLLGCPGVLYPGHHALQRFQ